MDTSPENILPSDHASASLVGRIWNPDATGPSLVCVREGAILDITSADAPTMRDLLEMDDPAAFVRSRPGASPLSPGPQNSRSHFSCNNTALRGPDCNDANGILLNGILLRFSREPSTTKTESDALNFGSQNGCFKPDLDLSGTF